MKKTFLFLATALCLLATSCIKDDDFKEIKDINGVVGGDMSFALPLGSGSLRADGLLGKWGKTASFVNFDTLTGLASIHYDSTFYYDINLTPSDKKKKGKAAKADDELDTVFRQHLTDYVSIDMFENFPSADGMELDDIQAQLFVVLKANARTDVPPELEKFMGDPVITNLKIYVTNDEGDTVDLPIEGGNTSFPVSNLMTEGDTVTIKTGESGEIINQLIQTRPKRMYYAMDLEIPLKGSETEIMTYLNEHENDAQSALYQVADIESFSAEVHFLASFPLNMKLTDVNYQSTIYFPVNDISESIVSLNETMALQSQFYIAVKFANTFPLAINTFDTIKNGRYVVKRKNGKPYSLFQQGFEIPAAVTKSKIYNGKTLYLSNGVATESYMLVQLSLDDLEYINDNLEADSLAITFKLNTKGDEKVCFSRNDELITSMYILINPPEDYMKKYFPDWKKDEE